MNIKTTGPRTYKPIAGTETEYRLKVTSNRNVKTLMGVLADCSAFPDPMRQQFAKQSGRPAVEFLKTPVDHERTMALLRISSEILNRDPDERAIAKTVADYKAEAGQERWTEKPVFEVADKYDESNMHEAIAAAVLEGFPAPGDYDPDDLVQGIVMEAYKDFQAKRSAT